MKRTYTDDSNVPLFAHPLHPNLVREFVTSLGATWSIFGTPESGRGLLGCLSPLAKVPVVAFARNSAHAQVMSTLVKTSIQHKCLQLSGEWTSKALAEQWSKLSKAEDSESSSSSSTVDFDYKKLLFLAKPLVAFLLYIGRA